jgi:hypothetical protein
MFFTAWPHMKSDFAFFTKHPLCGSFLRFQPNYPFPNFPSAEKRFFETMQPSRRTFYEHANYTTDGDGIDHGIITPLS